MGSKYAIPRGSRYLIIKELSFKDHDYSGPKSLIIWYLDPLGYMTLLKDSDLWLQDYLSSPQASKSPAPSSSILLSESYDPSSSNPHKPTVTDTAVSHMEAMGNPSNTIFGHLLELSPAVAGQNPPPRPLRLLRSHS